MPVQHPYRLDSAWPTQALSQLDRVGARRDLDPFCAGQSNHFVSRPLAGIRCHDHQRELILLQRRSHARRPNDKAASPGAESEETER
jgi:hypothetical protein